MAGGMPWILFQGDLAGQTIPSGGSDYYPNLTGLLVSPLNAGGTVDPVVYGGIDLSDNPVPVMTGGSSNEPFKAIQILEPGLYYYEFSAGWFYDWDGPVRVNYDVSHSDGFDSVLNFNLFVYDNANSYWGGISPSGTVGLSLRALSFLSVDERATDVLIRGFYNQNSGLGRTFNDIPVTDPGSRLGTFSLYIIRLSPGGHSNPLGLHISQHF